MSEINLNDETPEVNDQDVGAIIGDSPSEGGPEIRKLLEERGDMDGFNHNS